LIDDANTPYSAVLINAVVLVFSWEGKGRERAAGLGLIGSLSLRLHLLPRRRRPEGREDDVLEGAVLLHGRLELVEAHLAVAVGVHLVEHLVQLPGLRDVAGQALLGQRLQHQA